MDTSIWRFVAGCVAGDSPQHLFCAAENIATSDSGQANSIFFVYHEGQWLRYESTPDWSTIAMAAVRESVSSRWVVVAASSAGALWELRPKGPVEAYSQISSDIGFTNLAALGETIYACGMGRRCFRREPNGSWTNISAPWPSEKEGVIGFTSIAGSDSKNGYAVGWQGEVWTFESEKWERQDSPTNANLNAVTVASNGSVYCVGDEGVLLQRIGAGWHLIETETDVNLLDVCHHRGQLFVCSDSTVLRLEERALVNDFAGGEDDVPRTCLRLIADGDGYLYSVGTNDVFKRSPEGWERLA